MIQSPLLMGKVTAPDGEWLVGNNLPVGHPGRIEPDDPRRLLFKVWTAGVSASGKYDRTPTHPGWRPPLPAHDGRLEGVQVMTGKFACERADGTQILCPGESVGLTAYEPRCWFLPHGSAVATGVAICLETDAKPRAFGTGPGYIYTSFVDQKTWPFLNFRDALKNLIIRHRLIVVFSGKLVGFSGAGITLGPLEYLFNRKENESDWVLDGPTSFAVLYF